MSKKKICITCGGNIPSYIKRDGVLHNLKNRKRCLECSTFRLDKSVDEMSGYSNWSVSKRKSHIAWLNKRSTELKQQLVDIFGGCCKYCKYSRLLDALEFHHLDRHKKCFSLTKSNIRSRSWTVVLEEAQKCDLVCSRCHREIEAGLVPNFQQ